MFVPVLFTGRVTPSLAAATVLVTNDGSDINTKTISHASTTGNILVRLGSWANAAGTRDVDATWNGAVVPRVVRAGATGLNEAYGAIFALLGGATGTHDVVLNFHGNFRDCVCWVQDIVNASDPALGESGSNQNASSATSIGADIAAQNAASLLASIGVYRSGGSDPLSVSSGWTNDGERQSGAGPNDVAVIFGSRVAGTTANQTLTVGATNAAGSQAIAIQELLPI